jgi:protein TonB
MNPKCAGIPAQRSFAVMVLSFPLVGEDHPLRQHAAGILFKSALLSMMLHGIFAGGRIFVANLLPVDVEFEIQPQGPPVIDFVPVPDFEPKIPVPVATVPMPAFPDGIPDPVPFEPTMEPTDEIPSPGSGDHFEWSPGVVADSGGVPALDGEFTPVSEEVLYPSIPPSPIFIPEPEYPEFARDAGIEGDVVLSLKIGVNGRVEEIQVLSGIPMLDSAAIEALSRAVFRPAQHNGRIVTTWIVVPVRFTLD